MTATENMKDNICNVPLYIREMTEDHISAVLMIEEESFPTPWTPGMFREELKSPLCHSLVAIARGEIVGYISYSIVFDELHLRNIAINDCWKRCGIASRLIMQMIEHSLKEGATQATLEVRRSNMGAIRLYEKFGFEVKGIRSLYYSDTKEDALILWADLLKIDEVKRISKSKKEQ